MNFFKVDSLHLEGPYNVVVEDTKHLEILKLWARATQVGGCTLWAQVSHPGRYATRKINFLGDLCYVINRQSSTVVSREPVAPSANSAVNPFQTFLTPFAPSRALRLYEISEIVQKFANTAAIIESAGFSGVQVSFPCVLSFFCLLIMATDTRRTWISTQSISLAFHQQAHRQLWRLARKSQVRLFYPCLIGLI